jgi:beta-N-acetylhexosaminidase
MLSAFIAGLAGPELTAREAAVLREARPCGIILFARNAVEPRQLHRLTDAARNAVDSDQLLVLIDQEGGRVQRLRAPHWRALPPAAAYGQLYASDPAAALRYAYLAARLTAADLAAAGINTNCAPVVDVPVRGSHAVIGDRAYGTKPEDVSALGRAVAEGFMDGGVLPVLKHVPGHGRATKDSHFDLPVVAEALAQLETGDFVPFRELANMPAAMTAHVVFAAVDPDRPATTSPSVIADIVRGRIGFDGLLISDDLGMQALRGDLPARATAALEAGCDLALLCSEDVADTERVAAVIPALEGRALERFDRATAVFAQQRPFDVGEAEASLTALLHTAA